MGWYCLNCDWKTDSDTLRGPVTHETEFPDHKTEPDAKTVKAWAKAGLG